MEGFGRHYRPLEERLKQIDNQIPEVQGEIDFLKIQYLSSDQIFNEAKDLYSRWPEQKIGTATPGLGEVEDARKRQAGLKGAEYSF
jgi:hypothetical protein